MIEITRYRVTGRTAYRGNKPGSVFEARIPANAEQRAVNRGSIVVLERFPADLPPGKYRLPAGWPNRKERK